MSDVDGHDVTAELATEVAASLRPALWERHDHVAATARRRWIADVRAVIDRALTLGSIRGAVYRSRDAGPDLDLVLEVLDARGHHAAAADVRALSARGPDGRPLVEDPTGTIPVVPAAARRDPTGPLAVVLPRDELVARRARRHR